MTKLKKISIGLSLAIVLIAAVLLFSGALFNCCCCGAALGEAEVARLSSAAAAGDRNALWALRVNAAETGDGDAALHYLEELATKYQENDARIQYFTTASNDEERYSKTRPTAMKFLQEAADDGDAAAMMMLGQYYEYGRFDYPKDEEQALKWYSAAAEKGDALGRKRAAALSRPNPTGSASEN